MGFREDMEKLSLQVKERAQHANNEETTKQALVIPFLKVLGYDVYNPVEVKSEYYADFGTKKNEKVDIAVFLNDTPKIFLEAKPVDEKLSNHSNQLARYFNSTPEVKLAIITNGVRYKFFTDLNSNNIMDDKPFLEIDMGNISDVDIETLRKFQKESFDTEEIMTLAEELIYTSNLKGKLKEIFNDPPEEFIRFLLKDVHDTKITKNVIERFRPIVKKSISKAILDIVSQGLFKEEAREVLNNDIDEDKAEEENDFEDENEEDNNSKPKIITTEEELQSFEIVKEILTEAGKDISNVNYKDTASYFGIYNRAITNWFLRIKLDGNYPQIMTRLSIDKTQELTPNFNSAPFSNIGSRVYIETREDLKELGQLIIECFNEVEES